MILQVDWNHMGMTSSINFVLFFVYERHIENIKYCFWYLLDGNFVLIVWRPPYIKRKPHNRKWWQFSSSRSINHSNFWCCHGSVWKPGCYGPHPFIPWHPARAAFRIAATFTLTRILLAIVRLPLLRAL